VWAFRYFAYYGINFSLASFGGEIFTNFTLAAFAEILACVAAWGIKMRMGRIQSLAGSAFLVTFSCLFIAFFKIPSECYDAEQSCMEKSFSVFFAMLVKFGISLFANILITYTSEIYPTVVRSLGYGLNMTAGRLGAVFMPMIVSSMQAADANPLVLFGFLGIIAAFCVMHLPETFGKPLQDHIIELTQQQPLLQKDKLRNYEY